MSKVTVGLARRENRRANVFGALDLIRDDIIPKLADQVMLKPNFLSSENQLASSHADAMRGAIDFLLTVPNPPEEILIAEGGNETVSGQAFENFGYHALKKEYDARIRLVDLNRETRWETARIFLDDRTEYQIHMPKIVLDCPCTISMAVAKTHDVTVVTLALKNMIMGTIRKEDRVKMHGFPTHKDRLRPNESKRLNINLIRLAKYLKPDIGVIDGTVGLQGNGPGGTDAVHLGVAAASVDVFAVDAVMTSIMGFDPSEQGILHYADQLGLGVTDLRDIDILETAVETVATAFKPHKWIEQQRQWREPNAMAEIDA